MHASCEHVANGKLLQRVVHQEGQSYQRSLNWGGHLSHV